MARFSRKVAESSPRAGGDAVVLRQVDRGRAEAIVARHAPPGESWAEGYPTEGDLEAANLLLHQLPRREETSVFGLYEIVEVASGQAIGGIGFHRPPGRDGVVEVGYGVVPGSWNRGYATVALRQVIALAKNNGARRLDARAQPDNLASRRVMEKAGLHFHDVAEGFARYRIELVDPSEA